MEVSDIAYRFSVSELEQNRGAINRATEKSQTAIAAPRKRGWVQLSFGVGAILLVVAGFFLIAGSARRSPADS